MDGLEGVLFTNDPDTAFDAFIHKKPFVFDMSALNPKEIVHRTHRLSYLLTSRQAKL